VPVSKDPSCPICLGEPVAPRVAKCGHVYCWTCMLQYISLGEKKWRKCPICYEAINPVDLKPGVFLHFQKITGVSIATPIPADFVLMKRCVVLWID
jgi:Zinc finger, C3HC4 type (RING finger)